MKPSTHTQNNFDFLRFFAATLVWYGHCFALSGRSEPMAGFLGFESFGSLGVTIFFVISGYFVTLSYVAHNNMLGFARNRCLRILPALFAVVLISVFVLGPFVTTLPLKGYFNNSETWRYLKCMLVFPLQYDLPGVFDGNNVHAVNGSLWTLQHEFRLYIIIGLLGVIGLLRPRLMLVLLIALFALRVYGLVVQPDAKARVIGFQWNKLELMVRLMSQFACGSFLYLARDKIAMKKEIAWIAFVIVLGTFVWSSQLLSPLLFDIAFSYVIIYLGFLKLPLIPHFGKYGDFSYGIYLYAFPIQQLCLHGLGSGVDLVLFLSVSFCMTLLCAIASWHLIEKQAMKLKA